MINARGTRPGLPLLMTVGTDNLGDVSLLVKIICMQAPARTPLLQITTGCFTGGIGSGAYSAPAVCSMHPHSVLGPSPSSQHSVISSEAVGILISSDSIVVATFQESSQV